jgi:hypothetical protein
MEENSAKKLTLKVLEEMLNEFKTLVEGRLEKLESHINESESNIVDTANVNEIRRDLNSLTKRFDKKLHEGTSMNEVLKSVEKPALDPGDGRLRSRNGTIGVPEVQKRSTTKRVFNFK